MPATVKLKQFEGPLDLLLSLIEQEQLNISEVSLSEITENFLKTVSEIEDRTEDLADFLVIATKLLYLKSRLLLPYLYPAEEEGGVGLADQLKLYKRFVDASEHVHELWQRLLVSYGRIEPPLKPEGFFVPANAQAGNLHSAMHLLLKRLKPVNPLPQLSIDRTVSVKEKIESIYEALRKIKQLSFKEMLGKVESRSEVIVTFLAILELVKQEKVAIDQVDSFADMTLTHV
jgi:segregation and condensation protein A